MSSLLVFDHINDIVFTKYDAKFALHINQLGIKQGLIKDDEVSVIIDHDIIVQMFAPLIASHRIMTCQFGNSYNSFQCKEDFNMSFNEYMGYLFVCMGSEDLCFMDKFLGISISIIRYLCGPDVDQMKTNETKSKLARKLINSWLYLYNTDQAIYVEAVEQLIVNADLSSASIQALKESVDKLIPQIECSKLHALILVNNKFLSLYSSQNAKELSAADTLFTTILCQSILENHENSTDSQNSYSYQILLAGPERHPKCLPHAVHIVPLNEGVTLIYLIEVGNPTVAASLYETFTYLHTMQIIQIQRDKEVLQPAFENLDLATKRLNDSLKKSKSPDNVACFKQLMKKWEIIRKKYIEFIKTGCDTALLRAETLSLGFLENLKELLQVTSVDDSILTEGSKYIMEASSIVKKKMETFEQFLRIKAMKNFSLGSADSITINKYLEEFPGLVHFLYIDRTTNRITAPTLDDSIEQHEFIKKKVWTMLKFARKHLREGTLSLLWKDTTFSYSYFLWFEDSSGTSMKPSLFSNSNLPVPGILYQNFFEKLKEMCFPKTLSSKIRCYELICIHLGLVTASCVLEQTRRIAATIYELKGHPSYPIELL